MARQTVNLHSISFKSKSEALTYFKKMLNCYHEEEELNSNDDEILFELLQSHPEMKIKIGVGVNRFYRAKSSIHPTSCFHLERIDGSTTDFSYKVCIDGNSPTLVKQFYDACRYSVSDRLIQEKEKLFEESGGTMVCQKTGCQISIHDSEYRHTTPRFRDIVKEFISEFNIVISPKQISHGADMQYVVKFADSELEELFKKFHTKQSNLVSRHASIVG